MKFDIVVTSNSFSKNSVLRNELLAITPSVKFNDSGQKLVGKELFDFIGGTSCAIIGVEKVNAELFEACPNLKFVGKYGVGIDNVDLDAVKKYHIKLGWTGGVNKTSVAEEALCFMIGLSRNLFKTSVSLKSGAWDKDGGRQLSGQTIGIIGIGHIGKELIRLLKPFGCRILVNDIIPQKDFYHKEGVTEVSKNELFKTSDIVTLHVPLTPDTSKMINSEVLKSMKKTAYLVNTSRGGVVDQSALKTALKENQILGAALDVYEDEPPTDLEFLNLPNLVCTPHIGGNAVEAVWAMGRSAIEHYKNFRQNV